MSGFNGSFFFRPKKEGTLLFETIVYGLGMAFELVETVRYPQAMAYHIFLLLLFFFAEIVTIRALSKAKDLREKLEEEYDEKMREYGQEFDDIEESEEE